MGFGAFVDALVELGARRVQGEDAQATRAFVRLRALGLLVHNRLSRLQVDFESPLDARPVARKELPGGAGIDPVQETVQVFWAMFFAASGETLAQRFVSRWTYKKRLSQRAQVETCAADEQRHTTAAFDFLDLLRRLASPFAGGVVDVRRDEVDQVMRDALALVERHFGSGDLNLFVDLDGIAVDDLAVEF